MHEEPTIRFVDAMQVAYKRMRGMYSQTPAGLGELYQFVAREGLQPTGMPTGVYLTMPDVVPEPEAQWELWAPVAPGAENRAEDENHIGIKSVPATKVVSVMYTGPYDGVGPAYEAAAAFIAEHDHTPCGPPRELWYSDPAEVAPSDYVTEIQLPVA